MERELTPDEIEQRMNTAVRRALNTPPQPRPGKGKKPNSQDAHVKSAPRKPQDKPAE
jgi:hypothetical protein